MAINRLKPETLLRRLASDLKVKDVVRLRAIELLLLIEQRIPVGQAIQSPKLPTTGELANLIDPQVDEKQEIKRQEKQLKSDTQLLAA